MTYVQILTGALGGAILFVLFALVRPKGGDCGGDCGACSGNGGACHTDGGTSR